MVKKPLVIDACIARASSGEMRPTSPKTVRHHTHPTAKACREFLKKVLDLCYRVVMTPDIKREWDKHRSNFALEWRVSMKRRGKVLSIEPEQRDDIREQIAKAAKTREDAKEMLKDIHLIEAALETSKIVISIDKTAQGLFSEISSQVNDIGTITWRNPEDKDILTWLKNGANPAEKFKLKKT